MQVRPRSEKRTSRRGGFTLLEVLLVVIILGALAALVVPNLLGTQERAFIRTTQSEIKSLENQLEVYALEHNGRYPETLDELLQPTDLQGQPMKPYYSELPKDAWGSPLNYEPPGSESQGAVMKPRIWSNGPNGENEDGGGDDINNWSESESSR